MKENGNILFDKEMHERRVAAPGDVDLIGLGQSLLDSTLESRDVNATLRINIA